MKFAAMTYLAFGVIFFLLSVVCIFRVAKSGKKLARAREELRTFEKSVNGKHSEVKLDLEKREPLALSFHKRCLWQFFTTLLLAVVFIELTVLVNGGRWGSAGLFEMHLMFIAVFVGTTTLSLIFNGMAAPSVHGVLASAFFCFYGCMSLTGIALVIQVIGKYP